jgi:putative FmdB family regulatory protein
MRLSRADREAAAAKQGSDMPLYEYLCENCGHRFEVIQKFSDAPLTECPKCQGVVRKLPSSPAIQFKGSGFYITDYAKKSGTGAGSTKTESSSGGDKPSTSSSDSGGSTKSETPAPAKPSTDK